MPVLLLFGVCLSLGTAFLNPGAAVHEDQPHTGVRCTLQVVGPETLPFRAIRVRLTVKNYHASDFGPIFPLDLYPVQHMWNDSRNHRHELSNAMPWKSFDPLLFGRRDGSAWLEVQSNANPIILRPGEQLSFSFALCGRFGPRELFPDTPRLVLMTKTLFPEPGTYFVECLVPTDLLLHGESRKHNKLTPITTKITVREPQGKDKEFYDLLRQDDRLASAILWPGNVPEADQLPKLRDLIQAYPKSSYTPYAKFALARYYYARKDQRADAGQAIEILRDLLEPRRPYFAYEPYAMAALINLEPGAEIKYAPILDREYPDAVEWLNESRYGDKTRIMPLSGGLPTKVGQPPRYTLTWQEYRKRVPVDRWAKPAEKK